MKIKLISVNGKPATGKTTLTKNISDEFNIPALSMDEIKEKIYDHVESKDSELWTQICKSSYDLMFIMIKKFLPHTKTLIFDSPIDPVSNKNTVEKILKNNNAELFQIELITDKNVLWNRFKKRLPEVHSCHSNQTKKNMAYVEKRVKENCNKKIDIDSEYLLIDTTDFEKIDYQEIYNKIRNFLEK